VRRSLAGVAAAVLVTAGLTAVPGPATAADPSCPWVAATQLSPDRRAAMVLARMTLDDKIEEVHGVTGQAYVGDIPANARLCIPELKLEDGPAGVADGMTGVTQLPAPVATAASWDTGLARRYGAVVGAEEWGKGANVDLGPTVNIVRDPRWGRAFESYGEDPYLAGQVGAADIRGVQGTGVLAQVKHLAVYNQETYRNTATDDARLSERALREIYLPQFDAAVHQGGASSVMCSYSWINGTDACANDRLQNQILKDEWGFPGFVTSDWGATHSTVASANGGLDMQMPDGGYFGAALKLAVQTGLVPQSRLDDMVRRILAQLFRFGLFNRAQAGTPSTVVTNDRHAAVARTVAEDGTVLLRNTGNALPLSTRSTHSIAVIGTDAGPGAQSAGGGSAAVKAPYVVTPYDGISKRAGAGTTVTYAPGPSPDGKLPTVPAGAFGGGLTASFYPNTTLTGDPVATRTDPTVDVDFAASPPPAGLGPDDFSVRWTGTLTAPATGSYAFSLTSDDGSRLLIGGQQVIDNWGDHASRTVTGTVTLTAGQQVPVEVDYYQAGGDATVGLGWQPAGSPDPIQQAADTARHSDVAVVFASTFESEGADLTSIDLPGAQNQLVDAVAAANPNTVVVVNSGSAVTMPWVDRVRGVFEAWYPGQEDGTAIAALLFGDVNPSGKLPVSFPRSLADVPARTAAQWPGVGGTVRYSEGTRVGYRWYQAQGIAPLFAFGSGLSYTSFGFAGLSARPGPHHTVTVRATVTNTGRRSGAEVVQLYVGQPAATGEPPSALRGFTKVSLAPGQHRQVSFTLDDTAFRHWDEQAGGWTVTPGNYRIMIGDSSSHLPLTTSVTR
jgi:beta-glucosidase